MDMLDHALKSKWDEEARIASSKLSRVVGSGKETVEQKARRIANVYDLSPTAPLVTKRSRQDTSLPPLSPLKGRARIDSDDSHGRSRSESSSKETLSTTSGKHHSWNYECGVSSRDDELTTSPLRGDAEIKRDATGSHGLAGFYVGFDNNYPSLLPSPVAAKKRYGAAGYLHMRSRLAAERYGVGESSPTDWKLHNYASVVSGSPHLWSKDTDYVSGSTLKHSHAPLPEPCDRLLRVVDRAAEEVSRLESEIRQERAQQARLNITLGHTKEARDAMLRRTNNITEMQKQLLFLKGMTVVSKGTGSGSPAALAADKEKVNRQLKEQDKWARVAKLYYVMRLPYFRSASLKDVQDLHVKLSYLANANSNPRMITRAQFTAALHGLYGKALDISAVNRMYSSFDLELRDSVDIRAFVSCIRVLRMASEPAREKLKALFGLWDMNGKDSLHFSEVVSLLQTCSITDEERNEMAKLAKAAFLRQSDGRPDEATAASIWGDASREVAVTRADFMRQLKSIPEMAQTFHRQMIARLPMEIREELARVSGPPAEAERLLMRSPTSPQLNVM